jgi:hypothetical protein
MTEKKRQSGQAILIIAMLLLVVVILIALGVDGGNAWAQHRLAQNAVDAGVLAGIQAMAQEFEEDVRTLSESELFQIITDYTADNGIPAQYVDAWYTDINGDRLQQLVEESENLVPTEVDGTAVNGLEAWGDRHYDTFFIRVVGRDTMVSGAEATGWVWCGVCSGELLFPAAIDSHTFTETEEPGYPDLGEHYVIWDNAGEFPGGFGWVEWDGIGEQPQGQSETNLKDNILDTHRSGLWQIGWWVPNGPGVQVGAKVLEACEQKILNEEVLFLPIYDYSCVTLPEDDDDYEDHGGCSPGENLEYRIQYFIGFVMTCMHIRPGVGNEVGHCEHHAGSPQESWLEGYFQEYVTQLAEGVCPDGSKDVCTYKMRRPSVEP